MCQCYLANCLAFGLIHDLTTGTRIRMRGEILIVNPRLKIINFGFPGCPMDCLSLQIRRVRLDLFSLSNLASDAQYFEG